MILAIETSTANCSAALFDVDGRCVAHRDELIGRGHAERLVPLIEELMEGRRADRILVGVGPGSFTGIRVGIAAAQGLAIGWNCEISGMSSLALIAAEAGEGSAVAAVVDGGHGELFVQQFGPALADQGPLLNLPPAAAAARIDAAIIAGPAAAKLSAEAKRGEVRECWPSARFALQLPADQRSLPPKPVYARAPDAKAKSAA